MDHDSSNLQQNFSSIKAFLLLRGFKLLQFLQYFTGMKRNIIKPLKSKGEKEKCVICDARGVNCKTIQCDHQFCYRCLSKWGRKKGNCPLCRTTVRQIQYKRKIIAPQYLRDFDEQISLNLLDVQRIPENQIQLVFYSVPIGFAIVPYYFYPLNLATSGLSYQGISQ